jgi:hypothetical protein
LGRKVKSWEGDWLSGENKAVFRAKAFFSTQNLTIKEYIALMDQLCILIKNEHCFEIK